MKGPTQHPRSAAFLVAQVGAHAAAAFADRLAAVDLVAAQAGILRIIHVRPGLSQRGLSSMLGLPASRLVVLMDELEERGLVQRRNSSEDRRVYALHLTRKGSETLEVISRIAREHDDALCAALTAVERETLRALLSRIADQRGLTPAVHPGFSRLGRLPSKDGGAEGVRRRKER